MQNTGTTRRSFLQAMCASAAAFGLPPAGQSQDKPTQGFERVPEDANTAKGWQPISDRKVRVGIVGYGVSHFGALFGFQDHPNVEIVAVSDLFPDRCADLARACRCAKTYPSLEELVADDKIEAVYVATDAPSHARHCIEVLKHGKHVASAVPAVWGSLEDAENLFHAVKKSGLKYMMFEPPAFTRKFMPCGRFTMRAGLANWCIRRASIITIRCNWLIPTNNGGLACRRSGIQRTRMPTICV